MGDWLAATCPDGSCVHYAFESWSWPGVLFLAVIVAVITLSSLTSRR